MGQDNIIKDKSFDFAVKIVKVYKFLCISKREYVLSKQLLRAGTSIGANTREAVNAQSKKDFLSKMNIALKEADETIYWLELLQHTEFIDASYEYLINDCEELCKIIGSIVKTTKTKL